MMLTVREAASYLRVSRTTLYKLIWDKRQGFPAGKVKGSYRINDEDIKAWMRKQWTKGR